MHHMCLKAYLQYTLFRFTEGVRGAGFIKELIHIHQRQYWRLVPHHRAGTTFF